MRGLLIAGIALLCAAPLGAQDGAAVYAQRCATCHDSTNAANRAPRRDVLAGFTIDRIVSALESADARGGSMSGAERRAVAAYLSKRRRGPRARLPQGVRLGLRPREPSGLDWNGWGADLANYHCSRSASGLRRCSCHSNGLLDSKAKRQPQRNR